MEYDVSTRYLTTCFLSDILLQRTMLGMVEETIEDLILVLRIRNLSGDHHLDPALPMYSTNIESPRDDSCSVHHQQY